MKSNDQQNRNSNLILHFDYGDRPGILSMPDEMNDFINGYMSGIHNLGLDDTNDSDHSDMSDKMADLLIHAVIYSALAYAEKYDIGL